MELKTWNGEGDLNCMGAEDCVNSYVYANESSIKRTMIRASNQTYVPFPFKSLNECMEERVCTRDRTDKWMLVIDMNNCGGGTTFFINALVSMLKGKGVHFWILRNYGGDTGHVYTWNDEYETHSHLTAADALNVFKEAYNEYSCCHGVFVNHTNNMNGAMLKELYLYTKQCSLELQCMTHDFTLINRSPHIAFPCYLNRHAWMSAPENHRYQSVPRLDLINYASTVWTQNIANWNSMFVDWKVRLNRDKVKVLGMPDYYATEALHHTSLYYEDTSSRTPRLKTVGIIGSINQVKGVVCLSKIVEENPNYRFVVFGVYDATSVPLKTRNRIIECPYESIAELNENLKKYKPCVLLELSLWAETYSYTLTLAMLTQLPLLVLKKPSECTVLNRLETEYVKHKWAVFETVSEVGKWVEEHAQYYFYTIRPELRMPRETADVFGASIGHRSLAVSSTTGTVDASEETSGDSACSESAASSVECNDVDSVGVHDKTIIILTTTVNVSPEIECIHQIDKHERIATYMKAIRQWMHKTDLRFVVVENSGYPFTELNYLVNMYPDRLRVYSFDQQRLAEANFLRNNVSKGASELFSIHHVYSNVDWFRNPAVKFVVKVTGRFYIPGLESYLVSVADQLDSTSALTQNDTTRCELIGAHVRHFHWVFNTNMILTDTRRLTNHVEDIYKERCEILNEVYHNVLACPVFSIEPTQRGGMDEIFVTI